MELPTELWSSILQKTRSISICDKLYMALPQQTRAELKYAYDSHKEKLNVKIFCGFQNRLTVCSAKISSNGNPEFEFQLDNIFAVHINSQSEFIMATFLISLCEIKNGPIYSKLGHTNWKERLHYCCNKNRTCHVLGCAHNGIYSRIGDWLEYM